MLVNQDSVWTPFLLAVGSFFLLRYIWNLGTWLFKCIDVFFFTESVDLKYYGKWAVVTGATDGIGKAFCEQLAQKGMNIVLVSRSMEKLDTVGRELREKYHVDVKLIKADFSRNDIYEHISSELDGLEIGVLVNNVGITYYYARYFLELESEVADTMVQVNILSMARMTHIVLPKMLDRKRGVIINVGSVTYIFPYPFLAEYSATKQFVKSFTQCLQYEYKDYKSIVIQHLSPNYVSTNMIRKPPSFIIRSATSYVQSALKTVLKCSTTHGCIQHEIFAFIATTLPRFFVLRHFTNLLSSTRKKGLIRDAKKKMQSSSD